MERPRLTKEKLQKILDLHDKWLNGDREGIKADLSGAGGITSAINYMQNHFKTCSKGYVAYKTFGKHYPPSPTWKIQKGSVIQEVVNPNRQNQCGCGINVAPFDWVQENCPGKEVWAVLIEWAWLPGVIVPYNTDGKIRCERVRLLRKVTEEISSEEI